MLYNPGPQNPQKRLGTLCATLLTRVRKILNAAAQRDNSQGSHRTIYENLISARTYIYMSSLVSYY